MEGKKRKKIDSPYPCLRMKTNENGRENPLTISVSVFITGNGSGNGIAGYGNGNEI